MKDQTLSLIVKLNFLLLGLGLVIYVIWYLNNRGLPPGAEEAMGISGQKVTLCQTRVKAIEFPGVGRIFEENMVWQAELENPPQDQSALRPLNQVAMEKWFAKYCTIRAAFVLEPEGAPPVLPLVWHFVNGTSETLTVWPEEDVYSFAGGHFKSDVLGVGLAELAQLAGLENPLISGE